MPLKEKTPINKSLAQWLLLKTPVGKLAKPIKFKNPAPPKNIFKSATSLDILPTDSIHNIKSVTQIRSYKKTSDTMSYKFVYFNKSNKLKLKNIKTNTVYYGIYYRDKYRINIVLRKLA